MTLFSRPAFLALSLALTVMHAAAQPAAAADPRGRWITANGNLEVEVAPCGAALCGTVTQVLGNRSMSREGAAMEAADARPALGMTILRDFAPVDGGDAARPPTEWSGEIHNRENGKTYRCHMTVSTAEQPAGELVLHAYVGIPLFGKTQRWSRVVAAQ
ncbi:Uncharacterized conserved protein, DUF2147 family [Variovorax sp. CF079]|uniref:DUF2147 domain-containing protein n=1 Tax=Variovorax sp. CF079 TaxID=1882774 RepID=UPI00089146FF|nr:DUF2147 domain-containing protein [Variovorax sp. CF079]SDC28949.1 Uncharacterized conserved protein, DUF2147 family [Variovorax sp. CF079]